jgi:seryl-tRNA synthetase
MSEDFGALQGYRWIENGQSSFSGPTLQLFQALDEMFMKLAEKVQAESFQFPTFIRASELQKLDYFKSFPHLITFPVALDDGEENLKKFIEGERCDQKGQVHPTKLAPLCDCLTPAACYHFYIHFQNSQLTQPLYLTTRAHCYRREKYYAPLQRQWNFNMREIVCIGSASEVKDFLSQYKELLTKKFQDLNLQISWELATDPFFNPSENPKYLMQQIDPVKEEMIYQQKLSIGSVNFHKNYFGENFSIERSNEAAFSGCVAFGIERWIYAIVTTYGLDAEKWPWAEIQNG